jgi:hypothetical protein
MPSVYGPSCNAAAVTAMWPSRTTPWGHLEGRLRGHLAVRRAEALWEGLLVSHAPALQA